MSRIPAYKTVYQSLKTDIKNGVYKQGTLLPTEPELEKMFSVSRTTIRHAVSLLSNEGLLRVRQGYGTQVLASEEGLPHYHKFHNVSGVRDMFTDPHAEISLQSFHLDQITPSKQVADTLGLYPGEQVYRIQRISLMNGIPFCITVNFVKMRGVEGLEKKQFTNLYKILKKEYGYDFEQGDEMISAITADFTDAQILQVPIGSPLLFCKRVSSFTKIGIAEIAQTKLRPDCYQVSLHMEGMPLYLVRELEMEEKGQKGPHR